MADFSDVESSAPSADPPSWWTPLIADVEPDTDVPSAEVGEDEPHAGPPHD